MKILVIAPQPFYQDGRASISLKTLLEILAADGHNPTAMVYPEGEDLAIPGCRLLRLPRLSLLRRFTSFLTRSRNHIYRKRMKEMAARLLQREKFDLLLGCSEAIGMVRRLSRKFKVPYIYGMDASLPREYCREHPFLSSLLGGWIARSERRAVLNSSGVLATCRQLEQSAEKYGGSVPVQRLDEISLLDTEHCGEAGKKTGLRPSKGALTLMHIGNLEDHQGLDLLLEAFSLVCLDLEKIRLVIIGGSRAEISRLRRKAKRLHVGRKVIFTGPRPLGQLGCYLSQADILVAPGLDGYTPPLEIFSCLDSGRPLVATRREVHTQVVDDSIAMLVETRDSEMALGILRLANDEELRESLGARARQRVAEEYCREAYRRKLRAFFKMLRQHPSPV